MTIDASLQLKKTSDGDSKILKHQVLGKSRWLLNPVASG